MPDNTTVATEQVTSTGTMDNSTTNSTADAHLDAAFDQLVKNWDGTPGGTVVEDSETPESSVSTSGDSVQESQQEESVTPAQQQQVVQTPDYQQLYQQMLKDKELQQQNVNLLYDRLNDLSERYQNLKQESARTQETAKPETPHEVQELYDLYPEIAKAVDKMIDTRTKSMQKSVEDTSETTTLQLQQAVQTLAQQNFVNKVMSVHPDMPQIMQTRALHSWVDGLDSVQKAGATYIMQYGSADDIIDLVGKYKSAQQRGTTNTNAQPSENLVEKVKNAMSVPSNRQEPSIVKPQEITEQAAFDALARDYEKTFGWRK